MESQVLNVDRLDRAALVHEIEALYRDQLVRELQEERGLSAGRIDTVRDGEVKSAGARAHRPGVPPIGRLGAPAEVAAMVRMLCGPDARYITGQAIHVNGGGWMP